MDWLSRFVWSANLLPSLVSSSSSFLLMYRSVTWLLVPTWRSRFAAKVDDGRSSACRTAADSATTAVRNAANSLRRISTSNSSPNSIDGKRSHIACGSTINYGQMSARNEASSTERNKRAPLVRPGLRRRASASNWVQRGAVCKPTCAQLPAAAAAAVLTDDVIILAVDEPRWAPRSMAAACGHPQGFRMTFFLSIPFTLHYITLHRNF